MGKKGTYTRRTFVKGSAVMLAGAAAMVVTGCASDPQQTAATSGTSTGGSSASASTAASSAATSSQSQSNNAKKTAGSKAAKVYFTSTISAKSLVSVYRKLGFKPSGKVAVKLSTGEPGSNYLRPALIGNLVKSLDSTIVECNTAYGGERSDTASHRKVAADHGFTKIADVDIMDADGTATLPVQNGTHLSEDIVGSHLANYGSMVSLAHFKGHTMGGFGGALKNISIGVAASDGKLLIHSAGATSTTWQSADQDDFLESMAEAASAVCDHFDSNIVFVNVMNKLSVDCDCDSDPAKPEMADIGILASTDPVALDQACVDLVYDAKDGQALVDRIESRNGAHTLEHAQQLGVGSRSYDLVRI